MHILVCIFCLGNWRHSCLERKISIQIPHWSLECSPPFLFSTLLYPDVEEGREKQLCTHHVHISSYYGWGNASLLLPPSLTRYLLVSSYSLPPPVSLVSLVNLVDNSFTYDVLSWVCKSPSASCYAFSFPLCLHILFSLFLPSHLLIKWCGMLLKYKGEKGMTIARREPHTRVRVCVTHFLHNTHRQQESMFIQGKTYMRREKEEKYHCTGQCKGSVMAKQSMTQKNRIDRDGHGHEEWENKTQNRTTTRQEMPTLCLSIPLSVRFRMREEGVWLPNMPRTDMKE